MHYPTRDHQIERARDRIHAAKAMASLLDPTPVLIRTADVYRGHVTYWRRERHRWAQHLRELQG
jgi:hypothetical protein